MDMLVDVVVLAIAAGVVPGLVTVTLLLERSSGGVASAAGWVAGMLGVRLVQGLVFGLLVPTEPQITDTARPTVVASGFLVLSVLLFATAAWKAMTGQDSPTDGPSARWMTRLAGVGPGRAALFGALVILLGARQWVCTLGAIGAIGSGARGPVVGIATFVLFTLLATALPLSIVVIAVVAPDRSQALLDRMGAWMRTHDDTIVIVLGVVFGTLCGLKALHDFGLL